MKTSYEKSTDSLYVEVRAIPSCRAVEIEEDVAVDYGLDGEPVGYDIQHASMKTDLIARLILDDMPCAAEPDLRRSQLVTMKDEYDFSKGEQGKFFHPDAVSVRVTMPVDATWDDFFDSPRADHGPREQPPAQVRDQWVKSGSK